jgi:tRNA(Ile)-lysidine synthase
MPAIADIRRAVREALAGLGVGALRVQMRPPAANAPERRGAIAASGGKHDGGFVLVALSGGPDSLALAAATAFEAPRAGLRAGAVVVDHGLQAGSADAAAAAAEQARALGLDPVLVRRVEVGTEGGPEAAARTARYAALAEAAAEAGASAVLLGHTLDDQAETVLLGLARGSGAASLSGMAPGPDVFLRPPATDAPARPGANVAAGRNRSGEVRWADASVVYLRPLLGIRRATTLQFCEDAGLTPWHDPQNGDPAFARVRVRDRVLPLLEAELGPGIAEALARTAELVREDASALDHFAEEQAEELADHAEAGLSLSVAGLAHNPAALRQRIIRLAVAAEFGVSLSRAQTLEVARLVTDWHGQGPLDLPGVRVVRQGARVVFSARGREISSEGTAPA